MEETKVEAEETNEDEVEDEGEETKEDEVGDEDVPDSFNPQEV